MYFWISFICFPIFKVSLKTEETKGKDRNDEENESKTNVVSFNLKFGIVHYLYLDVTSY